MSNAAIVSNYSSIGEIYTKKAVEKIRARSVLLDEVVTSSNIDAHKNTLNNTDFIFSTWGMFSLNAEKIREYFPNLKCIFHAGDSTDGFAREYLKNGARVFNAPNALAKPVAEYTVSLIVMANKGFFRFINYANKKPERFWGCHQRCKGNYNTKVGIFGFGSIGKHTAKLLMGYDTKVFVCADGITEKEAAEYGAELKDKYFLMKECDCVTNHLTTDMAVENYFDYEMFSLMKDDAVFINTNVGVPQVNGEDLARVLTEKPDCSAFFDVTWPEPLPEDSKLLHLPNFYVTPHLGGNSGREKESLSLEAIDSFYKYLDNEKLMNEVMLLKN